MIALAAATDPSPLLITIVSIIIALIAFLIGMRWVMRRRARKEREHLVVDIAEPETLDQPRP
jgi:uncharacterized protein YybS (DUF2232 family)